VNGHPDNILVLSSPTCHWGWRSKHCFIHHIVNRPRNCCLFSNMIQLTYSETHFYDNKRPPSADHKDKFLSAVTQLLNSYQGSQIISFELSFCLHSDSSDYVDHWVRFVISKGAKNISLKLRCCDKQHVFSNKLYEGANTDLKHLKLVSRILRTNFTNQFSCLETLSLEHVRLGHNCHAQSLFCPLLNLKVLSLSRCRLQLNYPVVRCTFLSLSCLFTALG